MIEVNAAQYEALCVAHLRMRDKLLELAKACPSCNGTGIVTVYDEDRNEVRGEECGDCADIRAVLDG
jgi:hypothetical protein